MSDRTPRPSTSTERVRRYRNRIRKEGWTVVEVRVPADQVDTLRAFAKTLGKPKRKSKPSIDQLALFPDFK